MIALDTNALARLLIVDDSEQCRSVRALVTQHRVLLLKTVLLETEWVLRARFDVSRDVLHAFFTGLAETENFALEDKISVLDAIVAYGKGLDFADAMHLASARDTSLHTFDEKFAKRAIRLGRKVHLIRKRRNA